MGFGFNLFFIFILLPVSALLSLIAAITRKTIFLKLLGIVWIGIIGLIVLGSIVSTLFAKPEIKRSDIYGKYIIDRTKFPGFQADWQYNHFRFEITPDNSIYFYETENEKIIKTYKGTVSFLEVYKKPRIIISIKEPRNHIIETKPTLYSRYDPFYYVFKSPKFGNVFFTKGKWQAIEK